MKIITLSNLKGGVGKTSLCNHLAYCFLNAGIRTSILEIDTQASISNLYALAGEGPELIKAPSDFTELREYPYDIILIDTPPYLNDTLFDTYLVSDLVIVPSRIGFTDLAALKPTLALINKAKTINSGFKSAIVFNMVKPNTSLTSEIRNMVRELDFPLFNTFITDRISYTRAFISGGIFESVDDKAKGEITSLTDELLAELGI